MRIKLFVPDSASHTSPQSLAHIATGAEGKCMKRFRHRSKPDQRIARKIVQPYFVMLIDIDRVSQ